jgi:indolepyruvate ferredoxin oxidoreductase beta subunit
MARLLGRAATQDGLGVRVGQIYGLSQRGGSVEATVRIGDVGTAFISQAEADVVVGLEPLEAERILPRMSIATTVLVNRTPIVPTSLTLDRAGYPDLDSIVQAMATVAGVVKLFDANVLAAQAGDPRLLNLVMLGVLGGFELLPISSDVMASVVENSGPDTEARSRAFTLGHALGAASLAEGSEIHHESVHR